MLAINRKLVRDLWSLKGQATAIAFVVSSGVATFVMSLTTFDALEQTQSAFYREYRFADVFGIVKRAPESMKERIEAIPGVQQVETRVLAASNIDLPGYPDPITAQIVSVPASGRPLLNQLFIEKGRMIEPGRDNEILVSEAFATAHGIQPGSRLTATINGRRRSLEIAGIALSPDFIYQLQPGSIIPDFKTFGIFWMGRKALESAYDMDGAFNEFSLALTPEADAETVIDRIDEILEPYGNQGAYTRKDQLSHRYLSEEFKQLQQMATMFPTIFLGVAAFLLNVVATRLIATQREQVAILKAFGYTNVDIAIHYLKLIVAIVLGGVALGIALGAWMGQGMSNMYMDFYRFPFLLYRVRPDIVAMATLISVCAGLFGTVWSVWNAAKLPPAEAMQPAPPARYRVSLVERFALGRRLAQPTRMILRNIERRPVKALMTVVGTAFACAILMTGRFFGDAVDYMVNIQFKLAQRDDLTLTFVEPASAKAVYSLSSMAGVEYVEPFRSVPARLRFGHREYRTSLLGLLPESRLRRLYDTSLARVGAPPEGVLLTDHLAKMLQIGPGGILTVEVLEGSRPVRQVPVVGLIKEYVGVAGYMDIHALNRLMREGPAISGAYMRTAEADRPRIYREVQDMPRVAGTAIREKALQNFYDTMAKQVLIFAFVNTLLAGTIAFGVVYNSARIAFSERSRELASLRVLGFTRGEISYILLGELSILTLLAVPAGFLIGRAMCAYMIRNIQTDLFRIPLVLEPGTYSFAATVVFVSSIISGYLVRRKLDHLDLVAVLKTKE